MPRDQQFNGRPTLPTIVIETPKPTTYDETEDDLITPRARQPTTISVRLSGDYSAPQLYPPRKRSASTAELSGSGSETETEEIMSSKSSRQESESSSPNRSKRDRHSKSKTKSPKSDDWTDVTEPEERRRIQNRIAQRKFREKARENKERSEREAQNQEHAGRSYHIPSPLELGGEGEEEESGLPWGGISMRHVMTRGHEVASRRGSGRTGSFREDTRTLSPYGASGFAPVGGGYQQSRSYGSVGSGAGCAAEDFAYDEEPRYYHDYEMEQASDRNVPGPGPGRQRIDPNPFLAASSALAPIPPLSGAPYDSSSPSSSSVSSFGYGARRQGLW